MRGGYGIYYDQPLVGTFLQNAFVNPPLVANPSVQNTQLSNPGSGTSPTAVAPFALIATSDPFDTPRTQQWNVGVQRQLYARGMIDVGYVGLRRRQPDPAGRHQPGAAAGRRPPGRRQPGAAVPGLRRHQPAADDGARPATTACWSASATTPAARARSASSYTLSQTKTDATNDRDALDLPQNPLDLAAEYAIARTDRTHVFTAN